MFSLSALRVLEPRFLNRHPLEGATSVKDMTNMQFIEDKSKPTYFCLQLSIKNLLREGHLFPATGLLFFAIYKQ